MVDNTKTDDNKLPELITLKEASEVLKVHPNTLRAWDKKGILVAVRFGERRIRRYKKEDIKRLIESKTK
ncbi:MerR family transcriptional regulator [Patescibacteria group bacterium]|nr:MerR family transcriptional regulator [Patescibacteria group bacterium]MBU1895329.1 MerR family transcriptional regulator [Patescibacteria group bacterium]